MLPPEIMYQIAEYIKEDRVSLSSICRIDTHTYKLLAPILYDAVVLLTPGAVVTFHQAVLTSTRPLTRLIRSLKIGQNRHQPEGRMRRNMAFYLIDILRRLPNLRDLSLAATPATANICFGQLKPDFSLSRLVCPLTASRAFWSFLRNQSSITTLKFPEECFPDKFVHSVPTDILPNLKDITASADALVPFSRLRPVSHVTSVCGGPWFGSQDLVSVLVEVPVESITCVEYDLQVRWSHLLTCVVRGPIAATLRKWCIVDSCMGGTLKRGALLYPFADLLSHLEVLEEFIVTRAGEGLDDEPVPSTREWLGELAKPETWRRMIKTIKVVNVYGEDFI
ncbi:hypothetical protein FRC08_009768 [Ceratobasidium sp. 394]|nr:hypothetical protein FRC08_009768 [Ceratobasidium sp. 394]